MADQQSQDPEQPESLDQLFFSFTLTLASDQGSVELEDAVTPGGLVAVFRELGQRLLDLADYCEVEGVDALLGGDESEGNGEEEDVEVVFEPEDDDEDGGSQRS